MKRKSLGKKSLLYLLCVVLLTVSLLCLFGFSVDKEVPAENQAFINSLGVGYNIGNSLDACDWSTGFQNKYGVNTEGLWGNAQITEAFVKTLAANGIGTVRIPVTYMNHIDGNGNIDPAWLNRVGQVADWVIANNMYCIVDIHHDTGTSGWIKATEDNYNSNNAKVANMITQIANFFNRYNDHLILEGFNEMVDANNRWDNAPAASNSVFNKWNQLFVDTVRATGGNNSTRYLLVNTYAATFGMANALAFELPKDSVANRLLVGVHNYSTYKNLEGSFGSIERLKKRGYPIVIGEFGATASADFDRVEYVKKFISLCKANGYCPIWWDNGENPANNPKSSFGIFKRDTCEMYCPDIVNALAGK